MNMHGEPVVVEGSDLLARCIQHEVDHLDGILFIDRLDRAQRKAAMRAIREAEWSGLTPPDGQGVAARHRRRRAADAAGLRRHPARRAAVAGRAARERAP